MDFTRNWEMTSLDFISFQVGENTVWHKLSLIVFHTGNVTIGQTMQTPDSPPLVHHRALHFSIYIRMQI